MLSDEGAFLKQNSFLDFVVVFLVVNLTDELDHYLPIKT
jgi:hypothetical protein